MKNAERKQNMVSKTDIVPSIGKFGFWGLHNCFIAFVERHGLHDPNYPIGIQWTRGCTFTVQIQTFLHQSFKFTTHGRRMTMKYYLETKQPCPNSQNGELRKHEPIENLFDPFRVQVRAMIHIYTSRK